MITIRPAHQAELDEINSRYREIDFKLSDYDHEYIVFALYEGKKAGQGRLVKLNQDEGELGGIYVYPEFRKLGIAEKIVQHLIEQSQFNRLYCLPFEHLASFYKTFGFAEATGDVNAEMKEKAEWCLTQYKTFVPVLEMKKGP